MKPLRTLALRREPLADLPAPDLRSVVGGSHVPCVTHGYTCDYCAMPTTPYGSCTIECTTTIRTG